MIARENSKGAATCVEEGLLNDFLQKTLDSLPSHLAILREDGVIIAVNGPWRAFAIENGMTWDGDRVDVNYLQVCEKAVGPCSDEAMEVAEGIRAVRYGRIPAFQLEYPCHSPTKRRWFTVRVTRFEIGDDVRVVVTHDDITQRKLAEIRLSELNQILSELATTDGLTGVTNRRGFEDALEREWRRCQRGATPLSLIMMDVDYFKRYNDRLGHLAGDDCLKEVAQAIRTALGRGGDLVARYGGEEFVALLPGTERVGALTVAHCVAQHVRESSLSHPDSPVGPWVTLSLGCATTVPTRRQNPASLVEEADRALYHAKQSGRARMVHADDLTTTPHAEREPVEAPGSASRS